LKVTHGRIPLTGVFPLALSIDTVGPLADTIANLDAAYRAMSGDDTNEPAPAPLKLGIPQPWFDMAPMDETVAKGFDKLINALRDLGHTVIPVGMPDVLPAQELIHAIAGEITGVHRDFRAKGLAYGDDVAKRLDDCAGVSPEEIQAGRDWQLMIRRQFAEAFTTVDLLITPTSPAMRKQIGNDSIGERHYRAVLSWFSAIVNHSLHPAIALPVVDSGEPPVSLQAIGSSGSETGLIGFGRSLESAGLIGFSPAPLGLGSA
jgi:aspartyl-tRNA(Asn)/glutamyl-tRNA(Gln) amidotransferase subunit A